MLTYAWALLSVSIGFLRPQSLGKFRPRSVFVGNKLSDAAYKTPMNATKESLIAEIEKRVSDKILEQSNADLLIKLIKNADSLDEAINIAALGTTYKRTGLHFDKRLEKKSDTIKYFKKNERLSFHTDDNKPTHKLIIGDNYEALQNLLIQYKGKIDVIYIDPPYGKDSMGEFAKTNYQNAITRDNLLSMLYPRLVLAKQLLSDEGVIFCSIDDKNQAYVKCLFDEVMGEMNFVQNYIWECNYKPDNSSPLIRPNAETILCYLKQKNKDSKFKKTGSETKGQASLSKATETIKTLKFPEKTVRTTLPNGNYPKGQYDEKGWELLNDVVVEDNIIITELIVKGQSYWATEKKIEDEIKNGTNLWIKSKKFIPYYQKSDSGMVVPTTILPKKNLDDYALSKKELFSIIGEDVFKNPKPSSLVRFLVSIIDNPNSIVLDFFAGSGTTGHAVLDLNEKDEGNRTFILCQLNEKTDTTPNGIAYDVTAKRLKRIMTGECYDGGKDFEWIKKNKPYGVNLDVYEIESVADFEWTKGKTPFDVIDETLYGKEKFATIKEKIEWVCSNFDKTQKYLEQVKTEE